MQARATMQVCVTAAVLWLAGAVGLSARQAPAASGALTPVPRVVWFSGSFHPADGQPIGAVETVTVSVYRDQQGGDPLWQESQSIIVRRDGYYYLLLGATSADGLPLDLFTAGEPRWLGVLFNRAGEVEQPRVLLASVPYALKAADAETLGGKPASAYMLAEPAPSSTTSSATSATTGSSTTRSSGRTNRSLATTTTLGTAGYLGVFVDSTNLGSSSLFQNGGLIGLGTTVPFDAMHVQFTNTGGTMTGLAVQNLGNTATSYSGMLFYDQNGVLGQFQGFNNSTHEYRINNIAPGGSINFMLGSGSKFLVANSGNVGIGNAAPASKLDVAGDINTTGAFKIGGNATNASITSPATTTIGSTCTNYSGGQVTVTTVPGHTIEIVGSAWLKLNHVSGTKDLGYVVVGTTPTDCGGAGEAYYATFTISSSDASDVGVNLNVPFRAVFPTPASPGPVTYYLNAIMSSGQNASDVFWFANMTAHVY